MSMPSRILVATEPIDFRKQIEGIAALVDQTLRERSLSGTLFVFTNRRRDALKMLVWDHGGFVLIYKKLEVGRFRLPASTADRMVLSPAELAAVIEGIDLRGAKKLSRWNPKNVLDDRSGAVTS